MNKCLLNEWISEMDSHTDEWMEKQVENDVLMKDGYKNLYAICVN